MGIQTADTASVHEGSIPGRVNPQLMHSSFEDSPIRLSATQRPRQAVILAGGRGVRLKPFTDSHPKPMYPFHGKPFMEYLVELLAANGFERVMMLLGYMPDEIVEYFGDGSRWGIQIEYQITDADDKTGERLKQAEPRLDPQFLLMYCDNYWPMDFERMWELYVQGNEPAMIVVYDNQDAYTKDNMRIRDDGIVDIYDKKREASGLSGVDIGFGIFQKEVLDLLPDENCSFERFVYPELIKRRALRAFVTSHRYYSVGSFKRISLTETFLAREPAIFLDRDGVLNRKMPKAQYVRSWSDWEWMPGAQEAIRLLCESGYRVFVITNQAGIARQHLTESDLDKIHRAMTQEIRDCGGDIEAVYHCPHHWEDDCDCRKPKPGMLIQAQREYHLDLSRTWFVGDDPRDAEAARAAGCPFALATEERGLLDIVYELVDGDTVLAG